MPFPVCWLSLLLRRSMLMANLNVRTESGQLPTQNESYVNLLGLMHKCTLAHIHLHIDTCAHAGWWIDWIQIRYLSSGYAELSWFEFTITLLGDTNDIYAHTHAHWLQSNTFDWSQLTLRWQGLIAAGYTGALCILLLLILREKKDRTLVSIGCSPLRTTFPSALGNLGPSQGKQTNV